MGFYVTQFVKGLRVYCLWFVYDLKLYLAKEPRTLKSNSKKICCLLKVIVYGFYHGKSSVNLHLGNMFSFFPTTKTSKSKYWGSKGDEDHVLCISFLSWRACPVPMSAAKALHAPKLWKSLVRCIFFERKYTPSLKQDKFLNSCLVVYTDQHMVMSQTALGLVSISKSPKVNKHLRLVKYHKSPDLKSVQIIPSIALSISLW